MSTIFSRSATTWVFLSITLPLPFSYTLPLSFLSLLATLPSWLCLPSSQDLEGQLCGLVVCPMCQYMSVLMLHISVILWWFLPAATCIFSFNKFFFQLVSFSAIIKYLATELLELAGNAAHNNKKQHIVPRYPTAPMLPMTTRRYGTLACEYEFTVAAYLYWARPG